MSDKSLARRTVVEVTFDGVDISKSIRQYFLSMTYTDNEEDQADDLQIKLQDRDSIWMEQWLNDAIDAAASTSMRNSGGETSYTVTAKSGLNIRAGPGTENKKLDAVPNGTELTVTGIENGWATVSYNGQTAYVSASYIKESGTNSETHHAATGLVIQGMIVRQNWKGDGSDEPLDCGTFELDSVDCSGPPATVTIKGTSLPVSAQIRRTKKTKAWEKYYLNGIANEIAGKNGMVCMFLSGQNPFYERIEQYQTSDIEFLKDLCHDAGCSLKATNKMLVIFDQADYESRPAIRTIKRKDGSYTQYKLLTSTADTLYTSCRVFYDDPASGRCIEATAYVEDYDSENEKNQHLNLNRKVSSVGEAKALAEKNLRLHNKFGKKVQFTMPGDPSMLSGLNIQVADWGAWNGKYLITQAKHTVNSSGYTTTISARRILEGY